MQSIRRHGWLILVLASLFVLQVGRLSADPTVGRVVAGSGSFEGATSATTSATTVLTVILGGQCAFGTFEVVNAATSASALTDCAVQYQAHPNSAWRTRVSGADYGGALGDMLRWCNSTSPATLAAGSGTDFSINLYDTYAVRVVCTSAGAADVTVRCTVGPN